MILPWLLIRNTLFTERVLSVWGCGCLTSATAPHGRRFVTFQLRVTHPHALIKNMTPGGTSCGCFRGLVIADDIVHIHSTITGAVVSLTTGPSSGNVIGNDNGKVLFSRAALQAAVNLVQKIWPIYSWREVR